jgi:glyoxylase-like metal-dependent hydrolase (beta-lactamase superfamily II)
MKPATTLNKITSSLFGWASFQTQWKIDFNSYALKTAAGVVFIDPTMPAPAVLKQLEALGDPLAIVLTNAHHDRDADAFRKQYDVQIYAHEKAPSDCDTKVDVLVVNGETLPGGLKTIFLPGVTTSEMALFTKAGGGVLLIGDALLNTPGKGLQLLPDQFIEDKKQARVSLQHLLEYNFKIATFAHGDPIVKDAKKAIARFLKKPKR